MNFMKKYLKILIVFTLLVGALSGWMSARLLGMLFGLFLAGISAAFLLGLYLVIEDLQFQQAQQEEILMELRGMKRILNGETDTKKCVKCGKQIEKERLNCPYCAGTEFEV